MWHPAFVIQALSRPFAGRSELDLLQERCGLLLGVNCDVNAAFRFEDSLEVACSRFRVVEAVEEELGDFEVGVDITDCDGSVEPAESE
jgi:hypothetical protein